jgi:hypothetical protein
LSLKRKGYLLAFGAASIFLLAFLLFSLGAFAPGAATSSAATTATMTSYGISASSVIASAAAQAPAGYSQASSKQLNPKESGLQSGGFALFSGQGGSLGNMTILVFDTPQSAQAYIDSVVSNAKELSGYHDFSSALANYQRYGLCYGFGETDPAGNGAVATGVCTKGNVYIQVHLVSPVSLSLAQEDVSALVGAAYQGIN